MNRPLNKVKMKTAKTPFTFFHHCVGVANILHFRDELETEPAWVTREKGGYGFAEMVDVVLSF